jgi:uncharacterized protein YjbI with pentapeptide repeats
VEKGLLATEITFTHKEKFASFPRMRVAQNVDLTQAHFYGPVDLELVTVGYVFVADKAIFEKHLHANGLTVGNNLDLRETKFFGGVGLVEAEVSGKLDVDKAKFMSATEKVQASGLKVGGVAQVTDAFFAGPLILEGAKIGGKFEAEVAKDEKKETGIVFVGDIFLKETILKDAELSGLSIKASNLQINSLNLERVVVNRDLTLENIVIDNFLAPQLVVKGQAKFRNIVFKQQVDLQESTFMALKFSQVAWPKEPNMVNLSGLTYQTISGESEKSVLEWLNKAQFDSRNYTNYQAYLEKINKGDKADKVFIEMKRREWGMETWGKMNLSPTKWLVYLFWDFPVGYGRRPQDILWYALPVILLGALVLNPRHLEGLDWPQKNLVCDVAARLLLSVDKFTPKLLELGLVEKWKPSEKLSGLTQVFLVVYPLMGKAFIFIFFIAVYAKFR